MEKYTWIIQVALALFFLMPGLTKIKTSKEKLVEKGNMAPGDSITFIRVLGSAELLGCLAMIIPIWIGSLSVFTMLAAVGFCIVMAGAIVVHLKKKEYKKEPVLIFALLLSVFVVVNHL